MNLYEKITYLKNLRNEQRELEVRLDLLMKELVSLTEEALSGDPDGLEYKLNEQRTELNQLEAEEKLLLGLASEISREAVELQES
ncbi:MAG: hypothetical protein PHW04_07590 [Candidatus Wallbacteria bacterium]|nr:hypothetical protein [Candidatus Wallbacteria bacterium]